MITEYWDKQTSINDVEAEKILEDNFFKNARRIFLVRDEITNMVTNIESVDTIKSILKLDKDTSDDNVVTAYIQYIEEMNKPEEVVEEVQPMMARAFSTNDVDYSVILQDIQYKLDLILEKLG